MASSFTEKLNKFTDFRRKEHRSTDARGPQYGIGYDPVYNHQQFQKATGPLERRKDTVTRPEECFTLDERGVWMESKHAARILQIKEEKLSTLTHGEVEEVWATRYKEARTVSQRQEIMVATEVLMEYLDSTAFHKKNRLYYHQYLSNAKAAIDFELQKDKLQAREQMMWLCALAVTAASLIVFVVALAKGKLGDTLDVGEIGTNAQQYLTMSFLQPSNYEPAPDYNTRYFHTPTAVEVDDASRKASMEAVTAVVGTNAGGSAAAAATATAWETSTEMKVRRQAMEQQRADARELYDLLHEGETDNGGRDASDGAADAKPASLMEFSQMMAHNFGGGSRTQRMTASTAESISMKKTMADIVAERVNPAAGN